MCCGMASGEATLLGADDRIIGRNITLGEGLGKQTSEGSALVKFKTSELAHEYVAGMHKCYLCCHLVHQR